MNHASSHTPHLVLATAALVAISAFLLSWDVTEHRSVVRAVETLDGQWVERPAPPFELADRRGQPHRLADYRGEVVLVNFWASFCEPCRREMPSLESVTREYGPRGFHTLAVSIDPERGDIESFMQRFLPGQQSAMTVLWDPEARVSRAFGTELIPESYLIDRDGIIIARFVNEYDWTRPDFKRLVEHLLEQ